MIRGISSPSFDLVRRRVERAVCLLYKNDLFLITNNTSERAVTHKLGEYVQVFFPEWHVDCEYDQVGTHLPKAMLDQRTSLPDVIVHHRGIRDNRVVIEVKNIHAQDHSDEHDKNKIEAYIEDEQYQYRFGVWICLFDEIAQTRLDWFANRDGLCRRVSV